MAKDGPRQLALDLPHRAALGEEDFLVTPANAAAVEVIDRWPDWPAPALLIHGAIGTGKTHLVSVWQSRSSAARMVFRDIGAAAVELFNRDRALAIEDIDTGGGDERQLFHLLNLAREAGGTLLLTSQCAAGDIDITLPDLRSRLRALPAVSLEAPDDALLQGLLVKLFADRQLGVDPSVISYLVHNMERSAEAAATIVSMIDREALADRKRVTRVLASRVLTRIMGAARELNERERS